MGFFVKSEPGKLCCSAPSRRATASASRVEAVLVQIASHAVNVALSATARGYLLLIALECLRWRFAGNAVSSNPVLTLSIAQARARPASASVHLLGSAPHERVLQSVSNAVSKKIPLAVHWIRKVIVAKISENRQIVSNVKTSW